MRTPSQLLSTYGRSLTGAHRAPGTWSDRSNASVVRRRGAPPTGRLSGTGQVRNGPADRLAPPGSWRAHWAPRGEQGPAVTIPQETTPMSTATTVRRRFSSLARPVRLTVLAWSWGGLVLWWPRAVQPVTG